MKLIYAGKRDFKGLEKRRIRAARLFEKGFTQAEVARRLGASRQSTSRWEKAYRRQGLGGLKGVGRAGRKPRLGDRDLQRMEQGLKRGPQALGYSTPLWTAQRVAKLIQKQAGVCFHSDHVYRILQKLGWSCQRPVGRALERDERAISRWKKQRWPEIKKKPFGRGEPLSLSTRVG